LFFVDIAGLFQNGIGANALIFMSAAYFGIDHAPAKPSFGGYGWVSIISEHN